MGDVVHTSLIWNGWNVVIHYSTESWHSPFHHLEIKCKEPLPITDTGYRSHFVSPEEMELFDSPKAFVQEWLDHAAKDPGWITREQDARQLSLF